MLNKFLPCVALCLSLLAPGASQASQKMDPAEWTVSDLTGMIALNSIEERNSLFTVSFKNTSAEVITAAAVSFKDDAHHYQDWLNAESAGLAPGQTFDVTVGPEEMTNHRIRIEAILFEDGGGKGSDVQQDIMNFHRFGQILEGTRIGNIMRNRPLSHDDSSMNALTKKIGKLPTSSDDAFSSLEGVGVPGISIAGLKNKSEKLRNAFFWGVSTTRERALQQVENVRQLPVVSTDEKMPSRATVLSFVQEQYEMQNRKAAALLVRMQRGRQ